MARGRRGDGEGIGWSESAEELGGNSAGAGPSSTIGTSTVRKRESQEGLRGDRSALLRQTSTVPEALSTKLAIPIVNSVTLRARSAAAAALADRARSEPGSGGLRRGPRGVVRAGAVLIRPDRGTAFTVRSVLVPVWGEWSSRRRASSTARSPSACTGPKGIACGGPCWRTPAIRRWRATLCPRPSPRRCDEE